MSESSIAPVTLRIGDLLIKTADQPDEFEQVHALNYQTFVREIGQHADPGAARLVDKFHAKNRYLIVKRGQAVVAMLAIHDRPPFSVAARLPDPGWIERTCPRPLEVRLLTVRPGERQTVVLPALLWFLFRTAHAAGYSHLLASGVRQQLRLYRRIGFEPLGPEKQSGAAWFTPLALEISQLSRAAQQIAARFERLAPLGSGKRCSE